ncbi:hypothetical protein DMN80_19090 [Vibrio parahaemolyticus]|nr:hypothetical protein [Vibrio parahaemolyticus]
MSKWVVHIGAGRWQLAAIKATKEQGYSVLAVDGDSSAIGLTLADEKLIVDITNEQQTLDIVTRFFSKLDLKPEAVLCIASEAGQLSAASIREYYKLPGLSLEMAHRLTNKSLQRELWNGQDFSPEFFVINATKDKIPSLKVLPSSVIVKPVDSAGSRGITVLKDFDSLLLKDAISFASNFSKTNNVIIERYITGKEYTLESVVVDGKTHALVITEKYKVQGTNGTVANKLASADISEELTTHIIDTVSKAHKLLNYCNGVSHAEVIIDDALQAWIVEIAGRGAGFAVSERYIEFCTGFPYLKTSMDFSFAKEIKAPSKLKPLPSCIRFFESFEGKLKNFYVPDFENVESECLYKKGTVMKQATTDSDRIGYVMVKGVNRKEYEELLRKVEDSVKVEISVE